MRVVFDLILGLITNYALVVALLSNCIAQAIKVVYYYFRDHKFDLSHLVEAGGMPSSHSAMVCSLSTFIGLTNGWTSPLFAASLIFSVVVMYDAAGVRRAAGRQALILNKIVEDIYTKGTVSNEKLKELMGHSPLEVILGGILGISIAFIAYFIIRLI